MYFVNRSGIEEMLKYFESIMDLLCQDFIYSKKRTNELALERALQVLMETVLDVGNQMIDGFIMRDPGSYYDIIDILIDEQVVPKNTASSYKALIDARQQIVKQYYQVDVQLLRETLKTHQHVLQEFPSLIRSYLNNETEVANAFLNEKESE